MNKFLKKINYSNFTIIIILISIIVIACSSSPKPPECINEGTKKSELKWGILKNGELYEYYTMKMNGEIKFLDAHNNNRNEIAIYAPKDSICALLQEMGRLIIKNQTLSVPAEINHFLEYNNPEKKYFFRAVWNPEFETEHNLGFINLYKRLGTIAKEL